MANTDKIKKLLDTMGPASRVNRTKIADYIIENENLFSALIETIFETEYKYHHKAAWVLELILDDNLEWIIPHLDFFTNNLSILKNQSAIRPASKICKWIAIAFDKKTISKNELRKTHIENIVEAGFDWLIENNKVATQAYSMSFLFLFGKQKKSNFNWIHKELKNILTQNIPSESPAYKAQGKHVLKIMKKISLAQS